MNAPATAPPCAIDARFNDLLRSTLGPTAFESIRRRTCLQVQPETRTLTLLTPDAFSADHLERVYHQAFAAAAAAAFSELDDIDPAAPANSAAAPVHVRVLADPSGFTTQVTAEPTESVAPPIASQATALTPTDTPSNTAKHAKHATKHASKPGFRHRLSDFVVGDANQLAYNAATLLAQLPDDAPSPLFLHGPCGVGKTHLLQGLCKQALHLNPQAKVRYTTGERFTNAFILAVQHRTLNDFRAKMRSLDLLVIDDVHFVANKDKTSSELYHCIDELADHGRKLAFASDAHPKHIQHFSQAMISRCLTGLVAPVGALDPDRMAKLAHRMAARDGLTLTDEAAARLADHAETARELTGWLVTLRALAKVQRLEPGQPIGHLLLDQALEQTRAAAPARRVTLPQILAGACAAVGVTPAQALAKSRKRELVLARDLAVHLAKDMTSLSYPEIARGLQRPNHSTVITAHKRLRQQLDADATVHVPAEPAPIKLSRLIHRARAQTEHVAADGS